MKNVVDLFKWLLEADIRVKNAVSLLVALFSVTVFYFASSRSWWFQEIQQGYGPIGVIIALSVVLLIAFLIAGLVYTGIAAIFQHVASRQSARRQEEARKQVVWENLSGLTRWQRRFLLRFIDEDRTQIADFQVGGYKAAWDFEMEVLLKKEIIIEHHQAGVYEIAPDYHDYLKQNWNRETGELA